MEKREFLKITTAAMAMPLIAPIEEWIPQAPLKNWAGNLTYSTNRITYAKSTEEVSRFVKANPKFKVLGTRHCFNTIADSKDQFLSLRDMNKVLSIDKEKKTVTVEAGIKYGDLAPILDKEGFAIHNLASLPHISVAGACTTATHGSGVKNGNLSTSVSAIEFVSGKGEVVKLTRSNDGEKFYAAVVGLGAFGIVTTVTLDILPTFMVRQFVYEHLPFKQLTTHFDAILSAAYSISLFTDWQKESVNEVWIKATAEDKLDFTKISSYFGARAASKNMHPIAALGAENCTDQMGVPGPWFDRLPHFKMGFTPSSGVELQTEYFVPRKMGQQAFMAISALGKEIGPHLFISEIRTIAADNFWMSPCYKEDCMAIHFTWKQDWPGVSKLIPKIEKALAPFNPRPHWGKLFLMEPAILRGKYAKLNEFKAFVAEHDPKGVFRNEFLEKNLFS